MEFLVIPAEMWDENECFINLKSKIKNLQVGNDCVEEMVKLMQEYNTSLTKNEHQFQGLLQAVARKKINVKRFIGKKDSVNIKCI